MKLILPIFLSLVMAITLSSNISGITPVENWNEKRTREYVLLKKPNIRQSELDAIVKTVEETAPNLKLPSRFKGNFITDQRALVLAMMMTESEFKKTAKSPKGARGYLQLMLPTAKWLGKKKNINVNEQNIIEPEINIQLGVDYMNQLLREMDSVEQAILAYNAGPGAVRRWGGLKEYYVNVMKNYEEVKTYSFLNGFEEKKILSFAK